MADKDVTGFDINMFKIRYRNRLIAAGKAEDDEAVLSIYKDVAEHYDKVNQHFS